MERLIEIMKGFLKALFGKSIKTSLAGLAAGAVIAAGSALDRQATDPKAPLITVKELAITAAIGALGRMAKDASKTGEDETDGK